MQDYVVRILSQVSCSSKMMFRPRFNVLNLIYMIIHSAELFISFSFFFKGAKSNDPLHVDYVPSVFSFKKSETKKRASNSTERYERQQKRKKVKEEFHIQCKQPVEAAEDEINLVVEEETHKDKGLLFVPSISGLCLFFCHHFLYSVVPS